jgi:hypothetical protein
VTMEEHPLDTTSQSENDVYVTLHDNMPDDDIFFSETNDKGQLPSTSINLNNIEPESEVNRVK